MDIIRFKKRADIFLVDCFVDVALGNDNLIVDFGLNGLWNYDGFWIRLSHWDPKQMISWGESKLIVDFGRHGLYKYDGKNWVQIAIPTQ